MSLDAQNDLAEAGEYVNTEKTPFSSTSTTKKNLYIKAKLR